MSKLVVVAGGAGNLGHRIVGALLRDPQIRVRVLARKPASSADPRVEHVPLDVASATDDERDAAVAGGFSVVSALQGGPEVIDAQLALLHAAKRAGVRRFIPSDYSYNFFTLPEGVNVSSDWRRTFARRAASEASPSFEVVHVLQGMFLDPHVLAFLGLFDAASGTVRYWGDGTVPIDWMTMDDTASFIAAAATDERAVPAHLFVSGDRMDVVTFAKTWEAARGKRLALERAGSLEELDLEVDRRRGAEPRNMMAWLPLMYARGVFGGQALIGPSENARYPSIRPETVAQVIARGGL